MQDANWSVVAISDMLGDIKARYLFSPYGASVAATPTFIVVDVSQFDWLVLFAGYPQDPLSSLYIIRWRVLYGLLGRAIECWSVGLIIALVSKE